MSNPCTAHYHIAASAIALMKEQFFKQNDDSDSGVLNNLYGAFNGLMSYDEDQDSKNIKNKISSKNSLSTQAAPPPEKNPRAPKVNPIVLLIEAFARLAALTQKLILSQTGELDDQIKDTEELTEIVDYLSSVFSGLEDDVLWEWKKDPKIQKLLKILDKHGITIDGKSVKEWLESQTEKNKDTDAQTELQWDPNPLHWQGHVGGINYGFTYKEITPAKYTEGLPKYLLRRLEGVISGKARSESNANSKLQTELVALSQTFQNYVSAQVNAVTLQFRMLGGIFAKFGA